MNGGGPLPLSAFLDAAPPLNNTASEPVPISDDVEPVAAGDIVPLGVEPCLLTPDFLGCHLIASLGDELALHGGKLRIWCGAALHNDHAAAMLEAQARARQKGNVIGAVEDRADRVFSSTGASGSRLLGAPYLKAQVGDEPPLHVWLAPSVAKGVQAASMVAGDEAGADAERVMHKIGPYRLRVLSAQVIEAGAEGDALQQVETLAVKLAADRVRVHTSSRTIDGENASTGMMSSTQQARRLPKAGRRAEATMWLSTQGLKQVTFTDAAARPAAKAFTRAAPPPPLESEPSSGSGGSLPPIGLTTPTALPDDEDEASIDVGLHVAPLRDVSSSAPQPFDCQPSLWSAELSVMSLGTGAERHVTIPLQPATGAAAGAAEAVDVDDSNPLPTVDLGAYELRVLRCVGHHARATTSAPNHVVSDYPLLLLHVQVALRRRDKAKSATTPDSRAEEAKELGDELERLLGL